MTLIPRPHRPAGAGPAAGEIPHALHFGLEVASETATLTPGSGGEINHVALRAYRLARVRHELAARDVAGALLADPLNIRYATGTRNMAVYTLHAPSRYSFVATDGPVVLFELQGSEHISKGIETVDEIRSATPWSYYIAGDRVQEKAALWADEVASLVRTHGGDNTRLAVDRCEPWGAQRLIDQGIQLVDAQEIMEQARAVKSEEEIACLRLSVEISDIAVAAMRATLKPGLTENQFWSILHAVNIANGGEWIECRLLASGERTNPWYQESSDRRIQAGEIVAFDTDMVGPNGYMSDISRTVVCPGKRPQAEQRKLYELAREQILFNIQLLRPGTTFREFSYQSWDVPDQYKTNRYGMIIHGVGLVAEYPAIPFPDAFDDWGYDGVFDENMVVSVESYIGAEGGQQGVKIEEQVLITKGGPEVLSRTGAHETLEP
jgi:Xaa-Pro aminopeptidase